eukprot:TRINITY_DN1336_c1_g1_i3.p1 TRINITY_DN1336_c1_g1~~TRINITY_DN1336_c1_g1_i3.p1  ORF type:complete len:457 (+),score=73.54 TRINITY_DN1336_c1_g1_i3:413-1783(+)
MSSPPVSPRSPWGEKAKQTRRFPWQAAFGIHEFDTTDMACEVFGHYHNDRIMFTSNGQWENKKATVLGVKSGVLWVQLDDEECARDLKECFNEAQLSEKYGIQELDEDAEEWGEVDSPAPAMKFVAAKDEEELRAFEYVAPLGHTFTFNCSQEATEIFGYHHGQRVRATRGANRGRCATVIGTYRGTLWVHLDGDKGASNCHFCYNKEDLDNKYRWKVLNAPATSETTAVPFNKIEYMGPFGLTYTFERGSEALKPYKLTHGQKLQINRGIYSGKKAVVIGIQAGVLWWHVENDKGATACSHCANHEELVEMYAITEVGEKPITVKPNTSPFRNIVTSAEERRQQTQAIEDVSLDGECWDEAQQPQTYRYLRAYARWRLPVRTPPGQAFMLYYVKDTAPRTAEALDNLRSLRKYWTLQSQLGKPGYDKPFVNATEREMLRALGDIPLSCIKILSPT